MTALDAEQQDQVQAMIATALSTLRDSKTGLTRNATVVSWNPGTRAATVLIDGDAQPSTVQSTLTIDLIPGLRVEVTYQEPHGAKVTGLVSGILPLSGVWVRNISDGPSVTLNPGDVWQMDCGTYTMPADGGATVQILTQSRTVGGTTVQQVDVEANGDLFPAPDGGTFAARSEVGGGVICRFNCSGIFPAILGEGQVWNPNVQFRVGTGDPQVLLNSWSAVLLFWTVDRNIPN